MMLTSVLNALKGVHPKLAAASLAGVIVTVVTAVLAAYGHALNAQDTAALTTVVALVAGWLKPVSGVVAQNGPQDDLADAADAK